MSKASYRTIDYYLRPAKNVERKMILEVLKEVVRKTSGKFCYIGMGSLAFIDFRLFHKELLIDEMISIEKKKDDQERFEFNKPFNIKIEYGDAGEVLSRTSFESKQTLLWLDYDGNFSSFMLQDAELAFSKMEPWSIYLMTCRQDLTAYFENNEENNSLVLRKFSDEFGDDVPYDLRNKDFTRANFKNLIYRMLVSKINSVISNRNSALQQKDRLSFKQLFFFSYSDGAPMLSFGGILVPSSTKLNRKFNLGLCPFVRKDEKPCEISIPILTKREIDFLNSYLPDKNNNYEVETDKHKIPKKERLEYRELYRFFPDYRETVI